MDNVLLKIIFFRTKTLKNILLDAGAALKKLEKEKGILLRFVIGRRFPFFI